MVWLYILCVVNDSRKHIVEQWIGTHSRADQQKEIQVEKEEENEKSEPAKSNRNDGTKKKKIK